MNKNLLIIAVVAVVAVGTFFTWQRIALPPDTSPPPVPAEGPAIPEVNPPAPVTPPAQVNPPQNPPAATVKVTYTNSGFSPSVVTVKSGTTVIFQNKSDSAFWPASNPHPVHNGYPTDGGCVTSTFDACKEVGPGSSWSFKFDIVGTWRYHDHLRPTNQATIVVQ